MVIAIITWNILHEDVKDALISNVLCYSAPPCHGSEFDDMLMLNSGHHLHFPAGIVKCKIVINLNHLHTEELSMVVLISQTCQQTFPV